jgi:tRNA(Ile)-lysidine synthase
MPISSSEFNQLMAPFAPFEDPPTILIATSGGPDSMALALLANQWAKEQGGKAIAITVDHQLREDSFDEAKQVKAWLEAKGMEHHILRWERPENDEHLSSAIQAAAREARYQLLGQWCIDHNVKHLLTAHHAQDQLETFLIRLSKGSGLRGLTSTQGQVLTNFGRILRPLLKVDAKRLKSTLKHANQPYILDPSNENEDFTRVRWRQLMPSLEAEGLTPMTLQESLERLCHSQRLIEQYISNLLNQYASFTLYGYSILKKEAFQETPEAIEEMLKSLLETMRTQRYPVRRQALHRAMNLMKAGNSFTLAGCQIINKSKVWWIVREPAAIRKDISVYKPGTYLWDSRFIIEVSQNTPCRISALGEQGIQMLQCDIKNRYKSIPHIVLQSLPALWKDDELIEPLPPFKFTPYSFIFSKKAA